MFKFVVSDVILNYSTGFILAPIADDNVHKLFRFRFYQFPLPHNDDYKVVLFNIKLHPCLSLTVS